LTTDQVVLAAIGVVIVILVIVGIVRAAGRRPTPATTFGAGGTTTVPIGTRGVAKSAVGATGVVLAAGEEWTARSRGGAVITEGEWVTVVAQDGLTLIVEPAPADVPAAPPASGTQES
jgi:membrane protein implicated in regulation of membrane protease activity